MRIGILTFHRAINTGAALQACALQNYLRTTGADVELIDFYPNNQIPNMSYIYRVLRRLKRTIWISNNYRLEIKRQEKFETFYKKAYKLSKEKYYGDNEIKDNPPKYDILVSGSDQILNTALTGNSTSYYLDFDDMAKKVSYASSFGGVDISDREKELIKNELPKFHSLSFREQSGKKIVSELTGIIGADVLDPVFLMDRRYWSDLSAQAMKLPERYIFAYVMEMTNGIKNAVIKAREKYNLPVIVVNGSGEINEIAGREDKTCGPIEFLRYIKDADIVITNSFHGTAFSLIFEKKLLCVTHSRRNARLENLLGYIDCVDKQIVSDAEEVSLDRHIIVSDKSFGLLKPYVEFSRVYLECALK